MFSPFTIRRKPLGLPILDRSHPLYNRLTAFWLMNEGQGTRLVNCVQPGLYDVVIDSLSNQYWSESALAIGPGTGIQSAATGGSNRGRLSSAIVSGSTFTWQCRINLVAFTDSYGTVFTQGDSRGFFLRRADNKIMYYPGSASPGYSALALGAWHDIVIVCDAGTVYYYIDGTAFGTDGSSNTGSSFDTMFNDASSETMDGACEFQRIWVGRALTGSEAEMAAEDPYSIFKPDVHRKYSLMGAFSGAAGTGGFQAAWVPASPVVGVGVVS